MDRQEAKRKELETRARLGPRLGRSPYAPVRPFVFAPPAQTDARREKGSYRFRGRDTEAT